MTESAGFRRLLAKSSASPDSPRDAETLPGHTLQVLDAARVLLAATGCASVTASGLPLGCVERLGRIVRLAAVIHDLGKASDHFQSMVRRERTTPQLVRHEALTLILGWPESELGEWLRAATPDPADYLLALVAAAGHHRQFPDGAIASGEAGAGTEIRLFTGHEDFVAVLRLAQEEFALPVPPALLPVTVIRASRRSRPEELLGRFEDEFDETRAGVGDGKRLLALSKALTLAADLAGSALPRAGEGPGWISREFGNRADGPALRAVVERSLRGASVRPFQGAVAASRSPVTLVTAGCGTGKTLAAYLWASEVAAGRQVWFTYPTTGTATEGFRDYVADAPLDGRLEHSRASVDLELLGLDGERPEWDQLRSLRIWGASVVTATVDSLLGIVQNQRRGLAAWPGLAHSAVIFDEIHAYDERLFGALCRFLEEIPGLPVLLMTASLPDARRAFLDEVVKRAHGAPMAEIRGPIELENLRRYIRAESDDPEAEVRRCLTAGGKVLWVSNTVDRCVALADRSCGFAPELYHSRFRYRDRFSRHAAVVQAFRQDGPAFASTTQVAEMSLDLSADLLVTDLAPVPALIQRLGRLNRRSTPDSPIPPKPFVVLPFAGLPYEAADLDEARKWLGSLPDRSLSQMDLADAWLFDGPRPDPVHSRWLDGGFRTTRDSLREAGVGLTVLLERDADAVSRRTVSAEEVALPMPPVPRGLDWKKWRQVEWMPVAPESTIHYDPRRGGRWARP
ncbi:MAG: CRISPR-associated helicase Cas3' [Thermoanaerobaculia bacterium]|nr:CRISPR-associated helicase Cas3' [Thermoanaerobaculia bacterium]